MPPRKTPTRGESQARTRALILDTAEELFLAKGLHATKVAEIAAAAGRTVGSIYANFPSKEALCQAVLERFYGRAFAELTASVLASDKALSANLDVLDAWWRALGSNTELTLLVAEFMLVAHRHPEQFGTVLGTLTFINSAASTLLLEQLEVRDADATRRVEQAVTAILSTGIGLAIGQASTLVDADASAAILSDTARFWAARAGLPDAE
ncbi:TetR/AcrR family transcriptional regulator [Nocardia yamanashiensis]|uniref:TetR/AcrR family transcriptional regulator n=1 Tax=Nocardia yamanashiensis TaxID=209247 RepID=UPI001E65A587|nr:TetR/AcrR family transcriptional regulator [Nocardia yamanashiensis]UGT42598.1 TetR/AcrR family transcriptional regulator [Nocardia yamanashiensis]